MKRARQRPRRGPSKEPCGHYRACGAVDGNFQSPVTIPCKGQDFATMYCAINHAPVAMQAVQQACEAKHPYINMP